MDPESLFLRFDEWSGKIQRKLDDNRASINAINILMVVATFIAGVQATLISFTINLPQSILVRATNFTAFLGLVLEISGTFLGALHTLLLQRKVAYISNIANNLAETKGDLKIVINAMQQVGRADLAQPERFPPAQKPVPVSGPELEIEDSEPANLAQLERFPPVQKSVPISGPESELGDEKQVPEPEEGSEPSDSSKALDPGHDLDHKSMSGRSHANTGGFFANANTVVFHGDPTFTQINGNILESIKELDDLEERAMNVRNILNGMDSYHKSLAPPLLIEKIYELVGKVLATKKGASIISRQSSVLTIDQVKPAVRFMVTYGNIPSISMAGGVACLALSTILLAASQSDVLGPEVWITCLLTMVGVVTFSLLPTSSFVLKLLAIKSQPRQRLSID